MTEYSCVLYNHKVELPFNIAVMRTREYLKYLVDQGIISKEHNDVIKHPPLGKKVVIVRTIGDGSIQADGIDPLKERIDLGRILIGLVKQRLAIYLPSKDGVPVGLKQR